MIAIGLRDSLKIELRLPAGLTGHELAFLNAVDAIRSLAQVAVPGRQVEVLRNSRPSCWGEGQAQRQITADPHAGDLVPDRPTFCRHVGPGWVVADAPARHEAARPGRARTFR